MTMTSASAFAAPGTGSMPRGLPSRLVAGVAHGAVGLLLVSSVVGIAIANGIISRGVVKADAADVATLQAFAPLAAIFGLVGVAHVAAGLGIVFGSRTAAALGIGLGVLDLVAGVVILAFSAGCARHLGRRHLVRDDVRGRRGPARGRRPRGRLEHVRARRSLILVGTRPSPSPRQSKAGPRARPSTRGSACTTPGALSGMACARPPAAASGRPSRRRLHRLRTRIHVRRPRPAAASASRRRPDAARPRAAVSESVIVTPRNPS